MDVPGTRPSCTNYYSCPSTRLRRETITRPVQFSIMAPPIPKVPLALDSCVRSSVTWAASSAEWMQVVQETGPVAEEQPASKQHAGKK